MDLEQLIVPIIAIYGAILSTIIYYQKRRDNKPKIVNDYYSGDPLDPELFVGLVVRNFGKKPITLSYATIEEADYPHVTNDFVEAMD